jgi:Zn-dependent M28 family amino/carboxypeptidase
MRRRRFPRGLVVIAILGVAAILTTLILLINPRPVDPGAVDSGSADPGAVDPGPADPGPQADDVETPAPVTTAYGHVETFQRLADEYGDRAAGTAGYEAAARYVEGQLALAGYETTRQYFTFETRDEEEIETFSVLAETEGGDEDNVIMLGAHLDGVPGSPAINDNASGSAALLESARRLSQQGVLTNKVRFAWWGAEEYRGFPGSSHYVDELYEDDQLESIAAYLNFDMVASPNHVIALYDARDTGSRLDVPDGSEEIMDVLAGYFESRDQPWIPTDWNYESDQVAFAEADIPVGGLFTGSNERKSVRDARLFGGEAGQPRDPNYHQPGDDLDNVDPETLELTTDAITDAATRLARDTAGLD